MTSPTVPTFWSNAPRSGLRNLRLGGLQRGGGFRSPREQLASIEVEDRERLILAKDPARMNIWYVSRSAAPTKSQSVIGLAVKSIGIH